MLLNDEDTALIELNFCTSSMNAVQRGTDEILGEKLEKRRTGRTLYWKRFGKQEAPTKCMRAADRSTRVPKRTWSPWMKCYCWKA